VARVALHCRDLLFGSKVEGALRAAGHEVTREDETADIVVVDLTDPDVPWPEAAGAPRLGFYSHVDQETRRRAEGAGFDMVVPRSRMNREGAALVERLAAR
jgi:plasmid stability protein